MSALQVVLNKADLLITGTSVEQVFASLETSIQQGDITAIAIGVVAIGVGSIIVLI